MDMGQLELLATALAQEERLIHELADVLERQRAGVAADDAAGIDDSVRALSRTLLMLDEARRQRTDLVEQLTGDADLPLASLELRLGGSLPASVLAARQRVREAAERAAREVRVNQNVLRRAIEAGDAYLQALFASAGDGTPVYSPGARGAEPRQGLLLNRTA
jgi:hypothetical protein